MTVAMRFFSEKKEETAVVNPYRAYAEALKTRLLAKKIVEQVAEEEDAEAEPIEEDDD